MCDRIGAVPLAGTCWLGRRVVIGAARALSRCACRAAAMQLLGGGAELSPVRFAGRCACGCLPGLCVAVFPCLLGCRLCGDRLVYMYVTMQQAGGRLASGAEGWSRQLASAPEAVEWRCQCVPDRKQERL